MEALAMRRRRSPAYYRTGTAATWQPALLASWRALRGRRRVSGVAGYRALPGPNRGLCFRGGVKPVFRNAPAKNAVWERAGAISGPVISFISSGGSIEH